MILGMCDLRPPVQKITFAFLLGHFKVSSPFSAMANLFPFGNKRLS